ncbi:MAG TPA: CPBP family glutamic-type intramembrane protease [Streptosporangiaceae bacterium]|nr:CPBP family glutamic-type intramembrane protease [Streptosporangiaceae bacterium]
MNPDDVSEDLTDWDTASTLPVAEPEPARPASGNPEPLGPAQPVLPEKVGPGSVAESDWPGPVGRPPRAHWWSIQPPPPAEPISAGRAYAEALLLFAAFFAAGIVAGGETLAGRYPVQSGSWAAFTPATISELTMAAVAVALAVLLSARRGISARSLGLGLPRRADGGIASGTGFRTAIWALLALIVGGAITTAFATGKLGQPAVQDNGYTLYATAASLAAGVIEETIVLAFVVSVLRQAGRSIGEITVAAVVLRMSYHDYYGPGVIGIAVWAAVFIWLYLRTGSIIPLISVHFFWDATIFWTQRWHLVGVLAIYVSIALIIGAAASWWAERTNRGRPRSRGVGTATYTAWPFADPGRVEPTQADPSRLDR